MKTLFVNVKCSLGQAYKVANEIVELDGVSEVYSISGEYDLLVKCYLANDHDEGRFVIENIQKLPGVRDTSTIIAFNAFN
ncbi:MAG: Lrp/AsnC family transcriptional regulator [Proteobacteria bacterium]|nr:MAG: Lrp/AsnC family transcriptional regulator [Pseudomonadota bacterium]